MHYSSSCSHHFERPPGEYRFHSLTLFHRELVMRRTGIFGVLLVISALYEQGCALPSESALAAAKAYRRGDYTEAAKWYRLAAEQGHTSAQGNLGFMYGKGVGVPQDYIEAYKWLSLAARAVGPASVSQKEVTDAAAEARDALAARMTPTQIAKSQKLVSAWFRSKCGVPCSSNNNSYPSVPSPEPGPYLPNLSGSIF
jgi:TPR repeat protein